MASETPKLVQSLFQGESWVHAAELSRAQMSRAGLLQLLERSYFCQTAKQECWEWIGEPEKHSSSGWKTCSAEPGLELAWKDISASSTLGSPHSLVRRQVPHGTQLGIAAGAVLTVHVPSRTAAVEALEGIRSQLCMKQARG